MEFTRWDIDHIREGYSKGAEQPKSMKNVLEHHTFAPVISLTGIAPVTSSGIGSKVDSRTFPGVFPMIGKTRGEEVSKLWSICMMEC